MSRLDRKAIPLLSISTVMRITDLTARQIRYYEEHNLISPQRTEGNRRMFSLNDIDALLEVRELLEQGINMAGVKLVFDMKAEGQTPKKVETLKISDQELRAILREEMQAQMLQRTSG
ncbi:MerR family transcriptional regulator [Caryophanon tenue]|uniref:MerR family transcriptional regulator n=1 Tax=Caryophanon tenue TaxID=33978 RepID=A0A1C0YKT9_9BACL|nr:MerR family transcriptional regulator [Caryophanon tenue]OCS87788.1 MerR family transcriptional regulator [Caryophanon tenue]